MKALLAMFDALRQSVGMFGPLLLLSLVLQDDAGSAPSAALYAPPVVRPFEPPSDFGRAPPQDDAAAGPDTPRPPRSLPEAPVNVDAYRAHYEAADDGAQSAYAQGVVQAEAAMDGRMGPLDGRWRVRGADGDVLFSLSVTDPGGDAPLEGAWSRQNTLGAAGGVHGVRDVDGGVSLELDDAGRLRLRSSPDHIWRGEWRRDGAVRAVSLTPAG